MSTPGAPSIAAISRKPEAERIRPTPWIPLVALILTLFAASHAWTKGPYTQHVDEIFLLKASHKMLQSGNFDPGWYRYGSVSLHICYLGEALGYLDQARHNTWTPVSELQKSVVPLMRPRQLGSWPRVLFAILGGIAVGLAGLCANRLRPKSIAGPVTMVLLSSQLIFQEQWFGYLNVDIIASFFAMAATWAHLSAARHASWLRTSALPAALWGIAAATKYPLGIGVLSVVVADLLRRRPHSTLHALGSVGASVLTFLVFMPFALRNSPAFLSDLAFEMNHYAKGHLDFSSRPGLDAAWHHIKTWLLPLGPAIGAVLLGSVVAFRRYPSRFFTLLGPSLALITLLSLQATNFTRNSLLLGYLLSIFAGVGVAALYPWLMAGFGRPKLKRALSWPWLGSSWVQHSIVTSLLALVFLGPQWRGCVQFVQGHQESRDELQVQFKKLPRNARVAIPQPDYMASDRVHLVNYDPTSKDALAQLATSQATHAVVPTNWSRARYRREASIQQAVTHAQALRVPGKRVWHGGLDETWVHWPFLPRSNPKLELVALDRSQLTATPAAAPPSATDQ